MCQTSGYACSQLADITSHDAVKYYMLKEALKRFGVSHNDLLTYYEYECSNNDPSSCSYLGIEYLNLAHFYESDEIQINYTRVASLFEKGCNLNDYYGCFFLGYMHYKGKYLDQNIDETQRLFKKSCDRNNGSGCSYLALIHLDSKTTEENRDQTISLLKKSCELKSMHGCALYKSYKK